MLKRLKVQGNTKRKSMRAPVLDKKLPNDQMSNHCVSFDLDPQSEPEQRKFITVKAISKEAITSEIVKRPRGRPRKITKQTSGSTRTLKAIGEKTVTSEAIKRPRAEGDTSAGLSLQAEPKEKRFKTMQATGKEPISSETIKRPRGRPQKILKQTNKNTSDCAKSLHKEVHIVVKKELEIGGGEHMPKENTKNNMAGSNLSPRKREKLGLATDPDLHEQENVKSTVAGEKLTCSSVHKFYMRRSSTRTLGLKKG